MQVRCIDNKGFEGRLELGKVYTVNQAFANGYFVTMPDGINVYWDKERFEIVTQSHAYPLYW